MTADELVTDLELQSSQMEYGYAVSDWKLLSDAATMLRKQQAEIEALKSDTIPYKDLHQVVKNVLAGGTPDSELAEHKRIIREQQAEIEKLGSELNRIVELYTDKAIENEALKLRELSDEEIDKILKQHDWYSKSWVDMVRSIESAILKKASEK